MPVLLTEPWHQGDLFQSVDKDYWYTLSVARAFFQERREADEVKIRKKRYEKE